MKELIRRLLRRRRRYSIHELAPIVYVYIEKPPCSTGNSILIPMMVDTGAFATILSPRDASSLGVSNFEATDTIFSIDGSLAIRCKKIKTTLWVEGRMSDGTVQSIGGEATIYADVGKDADWGNFVSLLGRNTLKDFQLSLGMRRDNDLWCITLYPMLEGDTDLLE